MNIEQLHFLLNMTPADYFIKRFFHEKRKDEGYRIQYEALRYMGVYGLMPHMDKKRRVTSMKDVIPLPWEIEQPVKLTPKQRANIQAKRKAENDAIIARHKLFWASQKPGEA